MKITIEEVKNKINIFNVNINDGPISVETFLRLLQNSTLPIIFSKFISKNAIPITLETVELSKTTLNRIFSFSILPILPNGEPPDRKNLKKLIEIIGTDNIPREKAINFKNTENEDMMIAPTDFHQDFSHLAKFTQTATKEELIEFWNLVSNATLKLIELEKPVFINTNSKETAWLLLRLDTTSKKFRSIVAESVEKSKLSKELTTRQQINNEEIDRIESILFSRKITDISGPPGTGKSLLISKLTESLFDLVTIIITTETNDALDSLAVKLLETGHLNDLVFLKTIEKVSEIDEKWLTRNNSVIKTSINQDGWLTGKPAYKVHKKVKLLIGTVDTILEKTDPEFIKRAVLFIDEAGIISFKKVKKLVNSTFRTIAVGDQHQLLPFDNSKSVAQKFDSIKNINLAKLQLNKSFRLSEKSIKPLLSVYPSLKFGHRNELLINNKKFSGLIGLEFDSDSTRKGTSIKAKKEKAIAKFILQKMTNNEIDAEIASPYKANIENGGKTIDSLQGATVEVLILTLANGDLNEFTVNHNRLLVSISRAKFVTIVIGRIQKLRRKSSLFRNVKILEASEFIKFLGMEPVIKKILK